MIKTNSEYLLREFIRNINFYKSTLNEGSAAEPSAAEVTSGENVAALEFAKKFFTSVMLNDMEDIVDGWEGFIDALVSTSWDNTWAETVDRVLRAAIKYDTDPSIANSDLPNLTLYMTCIGLLSADNHNIPAVLGDVIRFAQGAPLMSDNPLSTNEGRLNRAISAAREFIPFIAKGITKFTDDNVLPALLKDIKEVPISLEVLRVKPLMWNPNGEGQLVALGAEINFVKALKATLEDTHIIKELDDEITNALTSQLGSETRPTVSSLKRLAATEAAIANPNLLQKIKSEISDVSDEITDIVADIDLDAVTAAINKNATTASVAAPSSRAARRAASATRNKRIATGVVAAGLTVIEMSPIGLTSVKEWGEKVEAKGGEALSSIIDLLDQYDSNDTLVELVSYLKENQNQN